MSRRRTILVRDVTFEREGELGPTPRGRIRRYLHVIARWTGRPIGREERYPIAPDHFEARLKALLDTGWVRIELTPEGRARLLEAVARETRST